MIIESCKLNEEHKGQCMCTYGQISQSLTSKRGRENKNDRRIFISEEIVTDPSRRNVGSINEKINKEQIIIKNEKYAYMQMSFVTNNINKNTLETEDIEQT